ncbi:MAG: leucine-rich repeat domain-containing protein, partial [Bryobacterales bacterium]|nr:leucine-rich repeat domain-containing protein [Bryobacterales bacterium]
ANLQRLFLTANELIGEIPPVLGTLTNLRSLDLGVNELSGTIPPELGALTNLQWLSLSNNRLNGKIPLELMQLSELKLFRIANTDVCVPTSDEFQAWLATISDFRSSEIACDGSLRVAFSESSYVVREGESIEVTVRLIDQTAGPAPSATIPLTVTPGGGTSGQDYTVAPDRITITAPASTGTFLVTAVEDRRYDHGETITLGFRRPLPTGVTAGSPDTATVTIIDPGTVLMTDRQVLVALYEAFGGPEWRNRAKWPSSAPLGEWFGVETDNNGRVTSLALPGNGLSGVIPVILGRLDALKRLDLGARWDRDAQQWVGNELSGAIPPELGVLSNLQVLNLGDNELSGEIPQELGGLTNLQELDLQDNELSGAIPPELGELTNLQVLNLWENKLSGEIPPEFGDLTNLQKLFLWNNELSGAIPPELGELTNLRLLWLWRNKLSGEIPPELGDLTNLEWLYLWNNDLSGEIPPELGDLTNLQWLYLWNNDLSGEIPPELANLTNLRVLYLQHNELSGEVPPELGDLTNLQKLNIWNNDLSGEVPPELGELTDLQELDLAFNELSGEIPPELGDLTNLQGLYLAANELSGEIPPELGDLTNLQGLLLWGNELSGTIPPELADLTNLRSLDLGFNPNLTGAIPRQLQRLTLPFLNLMATGVCVPSDEEFQEWLAAIDRFIPSGAICGRTPEAVTSIDVAVFYTAAARSRAGGTAEIEAEIDLLVAETNQAYEDGGVHQRIVLTVKEEVRYEEEYESGFWALGRLADGGDGYMDEVHAIRDRAGADLVHLIAEVTDVEGIAFITGAFGITCAGCDADVFAHELGHNMGLSHDRYLDLGLLPYSHGYVNQQTFEDGAPESARWFTIMAYPTQCRDADFDCERILRFSNPNQSYLGDPLGVPGRSRTPAVNGPADAVRALNITRHSVAAFRARSQDNISRARSGGKQAARSAPAAGVRSGGLFTAISPPKHGLAEADPKALRHREVAVDIGQLAQVAADRPTALPLNLFDDVMLTGVIVKRTPTSSGGYALTGPLFGVAGGTVALVVNGEVVAGTVRLPGATYRIRPAGAGRHAIVQVDPSQSSWRCGTEPQPR